MLATAFFTIGAIRSLIYYKPWSGIEKLETPRDLHDINIRVEPHEFRGGQTIRGIAKFTKEHEVDDLERVEMMFKQGLVKRLQAQHQALKFLNSSHVTTWHGVDEDTLLFAPHRVSHYVMAPESKSMHLKGVNMNFEVTFDHASGISRKGLEDAVHGVLAEQLKAYEARRLSEGRRLGACKDATGTNEAWFEEKDKECKDTHCKGSLHYHGEADNEAGLGATATCSCIMQPYQWFQLFFNNAIDAIIMAICGAIVKSQMEGKPKVNGSGAGPPPGLCECFSNCNVCICTFCCITVQASDTYNALSIAEYCSSLMCLNCLFAFPSIIGYINLFIAICMRTTPYQEKTNQTPNPPMNCLCAFFCLECVVCQQGGHVENIRKGGGGVVGQVVGASG